MNHGALVSSPRRSRDEPQPVPRGFGRRRGRRSAPATGFELRSAALGDLGRVLRIGGEIDLASGDALGAAVQETLATSVAFLMFDLSDIDFIDVAGLRALGAGVAQCRAAGCAPLLVLRRDGPVQRLHLLLERAVQPGSSPLADVPLHFASEGR